MEKGKTKEKNIDTKKVSGKENNKEKKVLVTSRILFISILDKVFLILLICLLVGFTLVNFSGDLSSISYGFFKKFGREIIDVIGLVILYFILNWFYKCFAKTMLCLTEDEVYKETYLPLVRTETTIPLNKITKVTSINVLWIFRVLIIYQYTKLPLVFFTWNNQEFKDKTEELLTKDNKKVENAYKSQNIINKEKYKYVKYAAIILGAVIGLIGIIRFFSYTFSEERKLVGVYRNEEDNIILFKGGSCNIDDIIEDSVDSCSWKYIKKSKKVKIDYTYTYKYEKYSFYGLYPEYEYSTLDDTIKLKYNKKNNTLKYGKTTYKKKSK